MKWKPVSKLTDADIDMGRMHHRLMFWNSCNGPWHYTWMAHDADDIKREGVWEKFLILPEAD